MFISLESFQKNERIHSEEFSFVQSPQISILPSKSYLHSYKIPKYNEKKIQNFSLNDNPSKTRKLSIFMMKNGTNISKNLSHTQEELKPIKEDEENPEHIKDLDGLRKGPTKYYENMMRNFVKMKKIPYEKEDLNQDVFCLKEQVKELLKQNNQLRMAYSNTKKANKKDEDLIKETTKYLYENQKFKSSQKQTIFIVCLKNELNKLKKEEKIYEEKLKTLKKHPKILKIEELDLEIKANIEEMRRLQNLLIDSSQILSEELLEENLINLEEDPQIVNKTELNFQILKKLKAEIQELEIKRSALIDKRNELQLFNEEINEKHMERNYRKFLNLKQETSKKQIEIKENSDLIEKYHQEINNLIIKSQIPSREQMKTEALLNAEQQLKHLIYEKDQMINYQTKYVSELNSKLEYKSAFEVKEKKLLQDNLEKQKAIFKEWDEKYKLLCKTHGIEERKIEDKAHGKLLKRSNEIDENENLDETSMINQEQEKPNLKKEIVQQVLYEDVMNYGYELNLKFKIKKLEYAFVEKQIFPEKSKKKGNSGQIALKDINEIMKKEPLNVTDEKKALLISRYLIESSSEKFLELDFDNTSSLVQVKTKFKKLVGNVRIYSENEEKDLRSQLSFIIENNYDSLNECFQLMEETKDKELIPFKVIRDAFRFLEIEIKQPELEYLLLNLFAFSYDLDSLPYKKLFEFVEKLPSSPLLKSPSKRMNSFILQKSSDSKKIMRASVAMVKKPSNFSSMSQQIEELTKNHEFILQKNKNKEIHTSSSSSEEESEVSISEVDEEDGSSHESKS